LFVYLIQCQINGEDGKRRRKCLWVVRNDVIVCLYYLMSNQWGTREGGNVYGCGQKWCDWLVVTANIICIFMTRTSSTIF
jgi:hypothetical protein